MSPREPVFIHPRKKFSAKDRARIFARDGGVCGLSGKKIKAGEPFEIEHRIALALGGSNEDDNLYVVLVEPHREKTKEDVRAIAKAKRLEARQNGTRRERKPIPSRPFDKPAEKKPWPKRPNAWRRPE